VPYNRVVMRDPSSHVSPHAVSTSGSSTLGSARSLPSAAELGLSLIDTLQVSVEDFRFLKAVPPADVIEMLRSIDKQPREHQATLALLRELFILTKTTMVNMNSAHPGLPPDTLATTLSLITRDGASVVVLRGRDPKDRTRGEALLGYGIVIAGRDNFPDGDRIPDVLFEGASSAHRLIRLFINDVARIQLPPGEAFSRLIETIKAVSPEGPIIGMVLTDIIPLSGQLAQPEGKQIWLEAKGALEKRGFEDTDAMITEVVSGTAHSSVAIPFKWYVYPPRTKEGRELYDSHKARFLDLDKRQRERLAAIHAALPLAGGRIHFIGNGRDAFDLAHLSRNTVYASIVKSSEAGANRVGVRPNLVTWDHDKQLALPAQSVDAVVVNGALPDIAGNDAHTAERVRAFFEAQVAVLKDDGLLVVRDTVAPDNRAAVTLSLNNHTAHRWSGERTVARLFRDFVASARETSVYWEEWNKVKFLREEGQDALFYTPSRIAAEFILKYPYASDWVKERERNYTLQTVDERLSLLSELGLRVVYAGPEQSAFIRARQRADGVSLRGGYDPLPTNHVTVAQRVGPHEGVGFSVGAEVPFRPERFVSIRRYERLDSTGRVVGVREVANRQNVTLDVVPYRVHEGHLYVWGRVYPRPLTVLHPNIDQSVHGGYLTEQLAAIVRSEDIASDDGIEQTAHVTLRRTTGIDVAADSVVSHPSRYFVRPDTVDEEVQAVAVEVRHLSLADFEVREAKLPFGGHYFVRAFDAVRILQGQQVGFSEDPRLERKVYQLLQSLDLPCGAWLGEYVALTLQSGAGHLVSSAGAALSPAQRAAFRVAEDQRPRFLRTARREFIENVNDPNVVGGRAALEYVEPNPSTGLSHESISVLPVAKVLRQSGEEEILVGLEIKDLPAVQERLGTSALATVPTTRLPMSARNLSEGMSYAQEMLQRNFGVVCGMPRSLGGKYVASPGVTPEVIYPIIAEVNLSKSRNDSLLWIPLRELVTRIADLRCGQAVTSLYRASHMYGLLNR
jgi:hypothetical protein